MKTMIIAAAAVLSLGLGSAFAQENANTDANTRFDAIPGVLAQAPAQKPSTAVAQSGQMNVYATQSSHGTWLFPAYQGGNG